MKIDGSGRLARSGPLPLHLQTAFDPIANSMKVVMISSPSDVAGLLHMLQVQIGEGQ